MLTFARCNQLPATLALSLTRSGMTGVLRA